ncbi:uncharacterized protein A1O9_06997 [Exophiala aquamarina CBS 119918]|uniref:Thiamine pyrophosphate enzyme N-terminal TPP-binding domain-containing protein n=1 Tax=Exophiala aquamarina CBS 119918 TaxID=1182545 RepID=A0A072PAP5_9EURO|nr:uncharacterized protein A1O9_06997 [Exophiala aquamarina CBS 119918]KEF56807.1 hypothetical protein A1O9_06997 [Exophiala aquamarina CBS 119918]
MTFAIRAYHAFGIGQLLQSPKISTTVKLAECLFARLHEQALRSVHGVPGLHWVGNCNELNAGYAADGYARINGVGAVITTFGVGEISAVNAIAGAYAEPALFVHIVSTAGRSIQDSRAKAHHTFNDGNLQWFAQICAAITVAQASMRDAHSTPDQIGTVLGQCLSSNRPVYIQMPVDMVDVTVTVANSRLQSSLLHEKFTNIWFAPSYDSVLSIVLEKIKTAKQPMILVEGESRALGITQDVQSVVAITNWPTWTNIFGKGLVNEALTNVIEVLMIRKQKAE